VDGQVDHFRANIVANSWGVEGEYALQHIGILGTAIDSHISMWSKTGTVLV
jgi:hypothetical protein